MHSDDESYILLLLSDSNLPTGSFVASSGLESYIKHGFASSQSDSTINFVRDSLETYARSALPFVADTHIVVERLYGDGGSAEGTLEKVLADITVLDDLYDVMSLNHVAKRASRSQGVALLTLFTKGFSRPSSSSPSSVEQARGDRLNTLVEKLKGMVRSEVTHGHLPVCWGVLTACLGLNLERTQYLHLFLHARSLLSASVRLNTLGPYAAQQILLHTVRPIVAAEASRCKDLRTGMLSSRDPNFDDGVQGPAATWPLGEILAVRHDLQHSRIFNS